MEINKKTIIVKFNFKRKHQEIREQKQIYF
jgi:hypothetical protein